MPLDSFKFVPKTLADWDRYFRAVKVQADTALTAITSQTADLATLATNATNAVNAANAALANLATLATSALSADDAILLDGQPGSYYLDAANLTGTVLDARIDAAIARDAEVTAAFAAHVAAADPHTGYQKESELNAASGYAGLNSSSRTTKGIDSTDDHIVDQATKGLVLKDTQGTPHYWRVTVSNVGALVITDLGTTKP
jgi:hypothetical protein